MTQASMAPISQGMGAAPASDPSQGAAPDDDGGGFTITLAFQDDGSVQMISQGGQSDGGDASGGMGDDSDQPQMFGSLEDALQALQQNPDVEAWQQQSGGDQSDQSGQGDDAPMQPQDAQAAWNSMAKQKDNARSKSMGGM